MSVQTIRTRVSKVPEGRPLPDSRDSAQGITGEGQKEGPPLQAIEMSGSDLYRIVLRCTLEVNSQ